MDYPQARPGISLVRWYCSKRDKAPLIDSEYVSSRPSISSSSDPDDIFTRTGDQWLRSVVGYLEFCAGSAWRNPSRAEHRWHPGRLAYLSAIRLVESVRNAPLPCTPPPAKTYVQTQADLRHAFEASRPRNALVEDLLRIDPALTNRKILSSLQRTKLARMLIARQDAAPRVLEQTA